MQHSYTDERLLEERERGRVAALESLGAVRPEVDDVLQALVDDVRGVFGTDLALVNLILPDVQYFRAWSGDLAESSSRAGRSPASTRCASTWWRPRGRSSWRTSWPPRGSRTSTSA